MTPDEIRQAVCKATCGECARGNNQLYQRGTIAYHEVTFYRCTANHALAEQVVKWVQEAREEGRRMCPIDSEGHEYGPMSG